MTTFRVDSLRRSGAAMLVLGLLLALAGWRAYTISMANFWSKSRPDIAFEFRPDWPKATFFAVEQGFRKNEEARKFEADLRSALARSPLDGRGYRLLGKAAEARGDLAKARALHEVAADITPRDLASISWLGDHALAQGDFAQAFLHLDRIMRIEPGKIHRLTPLLSRLATDPDAQPHFVRTLAANPPWRERVLIYQLGRNGDVAGIFPMVERLRAVPGGMSPEELSAWLDRLAAAGQWGPAYLTWVQSLGPEASQEIGNVYNGSFELEPGHSGFDWRFGQVAGAHVTREQTTGAEGRFALRITFGHQRVPFSHVRQLMALPPGEFQLTGRVRLDDLSTDRGLIWDVQCAGSRKVLGQSRPLSGRVEWSDFDVRFEVPAHECGGQWLTLRLPARIPAEQRIGGVAWFDDLRIKPR